MPAPGEAHLVYSLSLSLFSLSKKGGPILYSTAPHPFIHHTDSI